MGGNDQTDFLNFAIAEGHCYSNRFLARIGENWHAHHSYCALAFYVSW